MYFLLLLLFAGLFDVQDRQQDDRVHLPERVWFSDYHQADSSPAYSRLLPVQSWYTETGSAEFTSSVPLHEFTGESDHLTGMIDFDSNVIDFYLDLKTLKTGNSRRDRDMYRTLNTDEYPFAEFTGRLVTSFNEDTREPQTVGVNGEMSLHGVRQDTTVEGILQIEGNQLHLQAEWTLDITDYQIEPPGILFYRVRDEMDVRIEAVLTPAEL